MSGSIRLTGVNGLPLGGSGLRYPGVYAALDFANSVYELGGVSRRVLTALPGFTFTRASLAMGYDATGKLTYGPNNLLLQSQTFGTTWSQNNGTVTSDSAVAPDGTTTADSFVASSSANAYIRQSITTLAGTSYVGSVYIKAAVNSWALVEFWNSGTVKWSGTYINLSTGAQGSTTTGGGGLSPTFTITSAGNGWYRLSAAVTTDNAALSMNIYLASGNGNLAVTAGNSIYLWGAQLEAVTYQTTPSTYYPTTTAAYYGPRLVYDPVTLASQGILVEEARTNLCLQSQTFDNASWSKNGSSPVSVTSNSAIAPDGTLTADTLTGDNANADRVQQTITTTASAPYNFSVFLKNVNATASALTTTATSPLQITVTWTGADITAITQTNGTGTYRSVGNGWWRVDGQFTLGASDTAVVFRIYPSYAGSGAKSVYAWQAQIEAGTGASSPIPTTTASVTRAADVAAVTGLTLETPFSAVPEFIVSNQDPATRRVMQVANAGGTALAQIQIPLSAQTARFATPGGSATTANSLTLGAASKAAFRAESGLIRGCLNGGALVESATAPGTGFDRVNIGNNLGAALFLNGTISRIRIYNRALSDAQLQSLTS